MKNWGKVSLRGGQPHRRGRRAARTGNPMGANANTVIGAGAGALVGSLLGLPGAIVGAGIGAVVGSSKRLSANPTVFPPGARVLVDGRDEVVVRQAFPDGSSSYFFPHYKVDFIGGDKNVAVNMSRVGAVRTNPLITSQNTRSAERLIRSVAKMKFGRRFFDAFYEHGQWWVSVGPTGETFYSAVDAYPGFDGRGVNFEEIG